MKQLCSYGCGKEAKFQQKNGRFCCSKNQNSCESVKNRIRLSNKTSVYAKRIDNANKIIMCSFGCGKPANFYFNNGSYCCERLSCMCLEIRKKNSLKLKNRITWNKNLKNCFSEQTRIKISIGNKGKVRSEENRKQMSKRFKGILAVRPKYWEKQNGIKLPDESFMSLTVIPNLANASLAFFESPEAALAKYLKKFSVPVPACEPLKPACATVDIVADTSSNDIPRVLAVGIIYLMDSL